jgi:hypothetical protein
MIITFWMSLRFGMVSSVFPPHRGRDGLLSGWTVDDNVQISGRIAVEIGQPVGDI